MKKTVAMILGVCALMLMMVSCNDEPREVRTAKINKDGELVIIFTDGSESVVGKVTGEDGKNGEDGADGIDGKDGEKGTDGRDGAKGDKGDTGLMGPEGQNGRSVKSMSVDGNGDLVVEYDDGKFEIVDTYGKIYLFGGKCGDTAEWKLYSGGVLYIYGSGNTYDYEEGKTPWSGVLPMISAVSIDTSDDLQLGANLLFGIDSEKITYVVETTDKWIDMTDAAKVYATADNTSEPITALALGTKIAVVREENGYTEILLNGSSAYVETKYTVAQNGSVQYDPVEYRVEVINSGGANLRSFPDATEASKWNIKANVPEGSVLNCTGVSLNGRWCRVTYEGQTLYTLSSLVKTVDQ